MKIVLNGDITDTDCDSLAALLNHLEYAANGVATAVNGAFVPATEREQTPLTEDDVVEIVAPMAGG